MAETCAASGAHIEDPERWPRQEVLGKDAGTFAWLEYVALRASLEIFSRLPPRVQRAVVGVLARAAFHVFCRRRTRLGLRFARQALGPEASERQIALTVLGLFLLLRRRPLRRADVRASRFAALMFGVHLIAIEAKAGNTQLHCGSVPPSSRSAPHATRMSRLLSKNGRRHV